MEKTELVLAGNPNCGKTTIFNELTGSSQKIGNWSGVTVEKKEGYFKIDNEKMKVIDLPGIYGLNSSSEDEEIALSYLLERKNKVIINVVDSSNLERNLYLTQQLLELGMNLMLVLNMNDISTNRGINIDINMLKKLLKIPIISINSKNSKDIKLLKDFVRENYKHTNEKFDIEYPEEINSALELISSKAQKYCEDITTSPQMLSLLLLEENKLLENRFTQKDTELKELLDQQRNHIESILKDPVDILVADYRYGSIKSLLKDIIKTENNRQSFTDTLDDIVLNKFLSIPIFLGIMYLVFMIAINVGNAFIDFFDILFGAIFVDGFSALLTSMGSPEWLVTMLASGIGSGIQTVATFVPIVATMFMVLSFLEDSGYMARVAFIMDRIMRMVGLPGKAFVPMILGFGCTVPAIMGTRTMENRRDRIMAVFMSPFMSCGARLPVYVLFTASLFPNNGATIVFSLYIIGVMMAILTGILMRKTIFKGEISYFVMELPAYHMPRIGHILRNTWNRLKMFTFKAGKVIVIMVAILGFMNSLGTDGSFGNEDSDKSVLTYIGKTINPIFEPMGIKPTNWPASVSLFTGLFAKEAIVGTLNSLYSQNSEGKAEAEAETNNSEKSEEKGFDFGGAIGEAFGALKDGLAGIFGTFGDPFGIEIASETDQEVIGEEVGAEKGTFVSMKNQFTPIQAYAYLIFVLFYFPCIAAFGAVVKEIGHKWGWILAVYLTLTGWVSAILFYQLLEGYNFLWISIAASLILVVIFTMYKIGKTSQIKTLES